MDYKEAEEILSKFAIEDSFRSYNNNTIIYFTMWSINRAQIGTILKVCDELRWTGLMIEADTDTGMIEVNLQTAYHTKGDPNCKCPDCLYR